MSEPWVYWNDRFVPQSEACLTLHDAGFVMGATVTDMCRTFRHRLYRWEDHLARFQRSCQAAEIYPPMPLDQLTPLARELTARNSRLLKPEQELGLVLFATPGPIGWYLGEESGLGASEVTFGMHTFPLPFERYRPWIRDGIALVVPNVRHVPGTSVDRRIKQRSRLHWYLAERQAQRQERGAIALLTDEDGCLTETAGANVLIVEGDAVVSPPPQRILEGVSLQVIRELCPTVGLEFVERDLTLYDAFSADEVWLTSTPYCLAGVRSIQGHAKRCPGPRMLAMLDAWNRSVGMDVHRQILG